MRGVIPLAPSLDHAGCLSADVETAARAARVLFSVWNEPPSRPGTPVLGIPEGPYLERVPTDTVRWLGSVCEALEFSGYECRRVPVMADFDDVRARNEIIHAAEAARVHAGWFREYEPLYGSKMVDLIRRGESITNVQLQVALAAQAGFRYHLVEVMKDAGIDVWICPSAPGPAPEGLASTGDPIMNLPWTHAGLPVLGLPAGRHAGGLPMGLQVVGRWNEDELLLAYGLELERHTLRL
jgi:Asp-tRNA(Asn)/Glu-tRNA(Gln) amidotransferase A subunit family amidase